MVRPTKKMAGSLSNALETTRQNSVVAQYLSD